MKSERRTEDEIRREIGVEREQLADAVSDLRASVAAKRNGATAVGAALATGVVAAVAIRIARRRRG